MLALEIQIGTLGLLESHSMPTNSVIKRIQGVAVLVADKAFTGNKVNLYPFAKSN